MSKFGIIQAKAQKRLFLALKQLKMFVNIIKNFEQGFLYQTKISFLFNAATASTQFANQECFRLRLPYFDAKRIYFPALMSTVYIRIRIWV
jgi:hypothetical protein